MLLEEQKDALRAPWTTGDFGAMSRSFGQPVADAFVARLEGVEGARVLDVACGTGAATLPLARRGAAVTGLDLAPNLLAEARATAGAAGLDIRFDEGFAEELPYADASFDLAVSMFGVIFSPQPVQAVAELARILLPGGRIALANWTAESFASRSQKLAGKYLPLPEPGQGSPLAWGDEQTIRTLLADAFEKVRTEVVRFRWIMPFEPREASAFIARNAGPLRLILERLAPGHRTALLDDFARFFEEQNLASAGSGRTEVANEYLKVTATRR